MHRTPAEAATDVGSDDPDTNHEDSTAGIVLGAALGLTAWALIAPALLAAYAP